jgi:hypothetical protein
MAETPTQNQYGICGKCSAFLRPVEKEDTEPVLAMGPAVPRAAEALVVRWRPG